jgi:hypothetical protein
MDFHVEIVCQTKTFTGIYYVGKSIGNYDISSIK